LKGDWIIIHPEEAMTGRVVTAQYMPLRPDFEKTDKRSEQNRKQGTTKVELIPGR